MVQSIANPAMEITTSQVLPIPHAAGSTISDRSRDLAAFVVRRNPIIPMLKLAEKIPEPGQPVWLFAKAANDPEPDNYFYYATVVEAGETGIVYKFSNPKIDLRATSGAPVLNKQGEVVAINVASEIEVSTLFGIGNPVTGFRKHLAAALAEQKQN
jgi:hypothetical protein